jgi:hypothetical protein
MIHLIKRYSIATTLSALVLIAGCDEEEKSVSAVSTQFTVGAIITSEAGAEQTITLPFSDAIMANGTIEIAFTSGDAKYGEDFVTIPGGSSGSLKLNVTKGQTAAQFKVVPVDNDIMNEVSTVKLTLSNPSASLTIGSQSEINISFTDNEGPTKVDFETDVTPLFENASEPSEINVLLTSPATGTGTTVVSFTSNGTYGTHFTTVPAAVNGKITLTSDIGDEMETITFQTIDNDNVNGNTEVEFTIESAEGGVELGDVNLTHTVTITDDETPSTAAFTTSSKLLAERKTDGFVVPVDLTPTLSKAGTLEITIASATAVYGTHYTTVPAATGGKITLNIAQGASSTSFTVLPVNNDAVNADHEISFSMTASTGVVVIGDSGDEFIFTSYDDDEITTIADLRAMHTGSDVTLPTGTVISGVVISKADNVSGTDLHVQDATAGLLLTFATNHGYVPTDELKIDLTGYVLGKVLGVMTGGKDNVVANDNAIKLGTAALPAYQTLTVTEFNTNLDAYESELVQIENVGFPDADGTLKLSGSVDASNGTDEFVVRTETFASWSNTTTPYGLGIIRGVATEASGTSRLLPQVYLDDIAVTVDNRLITLTQSISHFSYIKKGAESVVQQLTINGANLTNDLTVTSPSYFMISKDNATFSNSLTYTPGEVSSDQTVYIKFAPNASSDGVMTGSVVVKSFGAATKSFTVNGVQGLPLVENFSYTVTSALTSNGWAQSGTSAVNPVTVVASGLTYTGYPSSGGEGVTMANTGQDIYKTLVAPISSGDVYVSFLASVSATGTGDYFLGISPSSTQTNYYTRFFAKTSGGGYVVGVRKNNESNTGYGATVLSYNTTYLFVVKYSFNTASTTDDLIDLFVFADPTLPASEPGVPEVSDYAEPLKTDITDIGFITLRQGGGAIAPVLSLDGVRIVRNWSDLLSD